MRLFTVNMLCYTLLTYFTALQRWYHYSDMAFVFTLQCPYTDPHTKLRYATAEEYSRIRLLPTDIVSGLLTLRHASNPVQ